MARLRPQPHRGRSRTGRHHLAIPAGKKNFKKTAVKTLCLLRPAQFICDIMLYVQCCNKDFVFVGNLHPPEGLVPQDEGRQGKA